MIEVIGAFLGAAVVAFGLIYAEARWLRVPE